MIPFVRNASLSGLRLISSSADKSTGFPCLLSYISSRLVISVEALLSFTILFPSTPYKYPRSGVFGGQCYLSEKIKNLPGSPGLKLHLCGLAIVSQSAWVRQCVHSRKIVFGHVPYLTFNFLRRPIRLLTYSYQLVRFLMCQWVQSFSSVNGLISGSLLFPQVYHGLTVL